MGILSNVKVGDTVNFQHRQFIRRIVTISSSGSSYKTDSDIYLTDRQSIHDLKGIEKDRKSVLFGEYSVFANYGTVVDVKPGRVKIEFETLIGGTSKPRTRLQKLYNQECSYTPMNVGLKKIIIEKKLNPELF